jgi:LacI family transcriptional regulator
MAKVTIEEISRRTGLSRGTISRALNDRPDINDQTKQRVLAECRKLNYVPSRAARSLATGRNFALAVVAGPLGASFMTDLLSGAARRAAREQYALQLVQPEDSIEQQSTLLQALANDRIDGVLLAGTLTPAALARFRESWGERPGVVSTVPLPEIACDVVGPDSRESGRLAARHVLQGAEPMDVVYVHRPAAWAADARLEGFREVCTDRGIDPDAVIFVLSATLESGEATPDDTAELQSRLRSVSRVVASDDFTAINVMIHCGRVGRDPGRDVAVMGQGNERIGPHVSPGLTTTECSGEEVGRRAVEVLLARAQGIRMDAFQTVEIAPRVVTRASTGNLVH